MSELELINSIRNHPNQFGDLVKQYQSLVFRTAIGFVHQKETAEDITQNVFIKVFRNISSFKGDSSLATWLYRITINECISNLRKERFKSKLNSLSDFFTKDTTPSTNHPETPLEVLEKDNLSNAIKNAVDSLAENQRIAFVLSKYDELSQKEIAKIMVINEGAVESLLQRAKKNLQKKLFQYQP